MDDRLRAVEVAFGNVDQRLETLERLHMPTSEANEQQGGPEQAGLSHSDADSGIGSLPLLVARPTEDAGHGPVPLVAGVLVEVVAHVAP